MNLLKRDLLTGIVEVEGVNPLVFSVIGIGGKLLHVVVAERQIRIERNVTVRVSKSDFNQPINRENRAISSHKVFTGIEAKGNRRNFAVHSDAEALALLHDLFCINGHLLTVVHKACVDGSQRDLLTGVCQRDILRFHVQDTTARSHRFHNGIAAKIKLRRSGRTVFAGRDLIDHSSCRDAKRTVSGIDIFGCDHLISRSGKIPDLIYWRVNTVDQDRGNSFLVTGSLITGHVDSGEDLTALCDRDHAFLRCIIGSYGNDVQAFQLLILVSGNGKLDRSIIQNIAVRSLNLNQSIVTGRQDFRGEQRSIVTHIVGVNGSQGGISVAHHYLLTGCIVDLEACAGKRDRRAGLRVSLYHLDIGGIFSIVDQILVILTVLADEHRKVLHELSLREALRLMDSVHAVRKHFADRKAVLVADQSIALGFLRAVIAASRGQIDLEFCAVFRGFDLRRAVIMVLDNGDLTLDNTLRRVNSGSAVELDLKVSG